MRKSIFMYLFFFAALWIVFQYANEKTIFEAQERSISRLESKVQKLQDSLEVVLDNKDNIQYFSLTDNENAYTYFDRTGVAVQGLESRIEDALISLNSVNGNPVIPFENATGVYKLNKIKILNHKWIIADFSNGSRWGEVLIQYDIDSAGEISFRNFESLIYPLEN